FWNFFTTEDEHQLAFIEARGRDLLAQLEEAGIDVADARAAWQAALDAGDAQAAADALIALRERLEELNVAIGMFSHDVSGQMELFNTRLNLLDLEGAEAF